MNEYTFLDMFIGFLDTLKCECKKSKGCSGCNFSDGCDCLFEHIPEKYDINAIKKALYVTLENEKLKAGDTE